MDGDRGIYGGWTQYHFRSNAQLFNFFVILAMLICLAFDPLFFGAGNIYSPWRSIPLGISVAILLGLRIFPEFFQRNVWAQIITQASAPISVNLLYHYYLHRAPTEHLSIVFTGNLLVVFFTLLSVNRMSRANLSLWVVSLGSSLIWTTQDSLRANEFLLISISYSVMALLSFLWRRDFKTELKAKYASLKMMIPKREAGLLTVMNSAAAWDQVFQPSERFSVCLCSDWRGYQKVSRELSPQELSHYFNMFYEPALALLERIDPTGTYYANWVADELFVIFYDENDDREAVLRKAVAFANGFAKQHYNHLKPIFPFPLYYDIGMASGVGLLGMQGPRGMKRTTITSEHAGIAKRLQTEAKNIRAEASYSGAPLILVDEEISKAFHNESSVEIHRVAADSPDLKGADKYFLISHESIQLAPTSRVGKK